jgi:hypothetical protein
LLVSASIVPLLTGAIVDAVGTVAMFALVGVMYLIMAVAVWFGPETQRLSLEKVGDERAG